MDSIIKAEKLRTMKRYKNSQFVYNLILSSIVALTCSFLCSHPFGFASLTSSMKHFFFISLPNIWSSFLNPKCLFIAFNVIVAFLVGESKLLGTQQSSPANDIYAEYVERSQTLRGVQHKYFNNNLGEEKKEEKKLEELDVSKEIVYKDKEIALEHKEDKHDDEKLEDQEEENDDEEFKETENNTGEHEEGDGEEESDQGLPVEKLNRRVEDFIARINRQRWLEARMLICGQA